MTEGGFASGVGGFLGVGVDRMERGEGERAPPGATGQCALFLVRQTRCFEGQRVIESNIPIGDVMPLCNKPGRRQQSGQQGQTFSQGDNSTRSDEAGKTTPECMKYEGSGIKTRSFQSLLTSMMQSHPNPSQPSYQEVVASVGYGNHSL